MGVRLKPKQCRETQVTIRCFSVHLFLIVFLAKQTVIMKTNGLYLQRYNALPVHLLKESASASLRENCRFESSSSCFASLTCDFSQERQRPEEHVGDILINF